VCRKGNKTSVVQVNSDELIFAHLPKSGVSISCDDKKYSITHDVDIGAIRLLLPCGCQVMHDGVLLARSQQKICNSLSKPLLEILLPVQLTNLHDWIPDIGNAFRGMRFGSVDNVLDKNALIPETQPACQCAAASSTSWGFWVLPVVQLISSITLWCIVITLYVGHKNQARVIAALHTLALVPVSKARPVVVECRVNGEEVIREYVILGLIAFYVLTMLARQAYKKACGSFDEHVEQAVRIKELKDKAGG